MTDNKITLGQIVEFYILESINFEISKLLAANPEVGRAAMEKLLEDVAEYRDWLIHPLATALRDYMFLACTGEARHCRALLNGAEYKTRPAVYQATALKFRPSEASFKELSAVFKDNEWSGSYGGKAWGKISDHGAQYGKIADAAFIDIAASLAHNNGTMFNKLETQSILHFDLSRHESLGSFLDIQHAALNLLTYSRYIYGWHGSQSDKYTYDEKSVVQEITPRCLRLAKKAAGMLYPDNDIPNDNWLLGVNPIGLFNYNESLYESPVWGDSTWHWARRINAYANEPKVQSWLPFCNDNGVYDFCEKCAPMLEQMAWHEYMVDGIALRVHGGMTEYGEYDDDVDNDETVMHDPWFGAIFKEVTVHECT